MADVTARTEHQIYQGTRPVALSTAIPGLEICGRTVVDEVIPSPLCCPDYTAATVRHTTGLWRVSGPGVAVPEVVRITLAILWALLLVLAPARTALAQEDDTGVGQIGGFLGGLAGVGGMHPAGGFNFGVATARHLEPNFEFAMSTLNDKGYRVVALPVSSSVLQRARLYDFNGSVRVRFPNRTHAVPYIGVGVALLDFTASLETAGGTQTMTTEHQSTSYVSPTLSAGFTYFITPHIGIRPELKGYFFKHSFARLAIGIFYQFP